MVIDAASINARLDKLREQIVLLNEAKKLGLGDFKKDQNLHLRGVSW